MGSTAFTRTAYAASYDMYVPRTGPATQRAFEEARRTGKLDPLVDPAEYGVVRESRTRFNERPDGLWECTMGLPMPVEVRLDTTGSMGTNVEVALRVLPDSFELINKVLRPDTDLQMAIGIFGDAVDDFILCRPQFEMMADRIVQQLTLMVPEHGGGGNGGEDPQNGLFGAAYLTKAHINRYGLKGYDFTVSDEPARYRLSAQQLERVFGREVFAKAAENGWPISEHELPDTKQVINDLLKRAHGFFLEVDGGYRRNHRGVSDTHQFWLDVYGEDRVVVLPSVRLLPQVQATIIGLTEGTLGLGDVTDFLLEAEVPSDDTARILRSVSNIPIGAQPVVEGLPRPGDLFRNKADTWPIGHNDIQPAIEVTYDDESDGPGWL